MSFDFNQEMAQRVAKVQSIIEKYLPKEEGYQKTLLEAMNYSMLAGGKRLRPLLMLETFRMFSGDGADVENPVSNTENTEANSSISNAEDTAGQSSVCYECDNEIIEPSQSFCELSFLEESASSENSSHCDSSVKESERIDEQLSLVEPFMAGIEMIHTHSLIHDDLPAMDNDEYRRGRKTTHVVYGEAMAILAGDALLNYAYETMSRAFTEKNTLSTEEMLRAAKALAVLAAKTGIHGMMGGQAVDVENDGRAIEGEMLDFIYRLKTSALIEGSMMAGAILAGADDQAVAKIEKIAADVGLAFQIQDDILDVTSSTEELGKPVHSDEKNHKLTYVTWKGLDQARQDVDRISRRAVAQLDELMQEYRCENPFLKELLLYLINRKN